MELLGGLLVIGVLVWTTLSICAGGSCREEPAMKPRSAKGKRSA